MSLRQETVPRLSRHSWLWGGPPSVPDTYLRRWQHAAGVASGAPSESPLAALAAHLDVIASETRLRILHALRTPTTLQDIRLPASHSKPGERPERPLSRQTIAHHLEQLERAGLVVRRAGPAGARGTLYVLNHERLFAFIDQLSNLTKLRPIFPGAVPPGATVDRSVGATHRLPAPPRLVVAYGREDGVGFGLEGPAGTRFRIGRAAECEVRLDHDPYVSSENTILERDDDGFVVHDLATNRNGTWLNWTRLAAGGSARLESGDALIVGRTILVFKE